MMQYSPYDHFELDVWWLYSATPSHWMILQGNEIIDSLFNELLIKVGHISAKPVPICKSSNFEAYE